MDTRATVLAILPLMVVALGFDIYCWRDIARSNSTKVLPKWVWVVIVAASFPIGGIVYLLTGRKQNDY